MQAESIPKTSFFDDEDPSGNFAFVLPEQKQQKDLQTPSTLKDTFSVNFTGADSSKKFTFGLHNKLLAQYKDTSSSCPDQVLDLSFSRFKYLRPEEGLGEFGFSVTKNANTYEFSTSDKQVADNWFEALKKVCVLNTFHDDYKAIKMIGRGSFAKVYLVESKTNGKSYAVKAFTKDAMAVSNKNNAKPSMLNEIDIMRTVDHENIIKLYEVYETEKSIYLVLELIEGKSLYEVLKKCNFREEASATRVINMVRSLLDALAYLSSKGIMHRDLKPDNILLDRGEKVKIVDFGLATFIDVPVYIFKKCGTPGYIAPEVFKYDDKEAATNYNDRCDVFSVGCLFYYMLFNTPLFSGSTAADILKLNRKFAADYPVLNSIKLELKDAGSKISKDGLELLNSLIEHDAKRRISATEALAHSYFIPVPMGMQKISGSNEFMVEALSKFSQSEVYSPCTPLKYNSIIPDQIYSPLTPLRIESDKDSPLLPHRGDRFVREDSLYLDMGKPELNGRIDTLTNGSTNNSLLLNNRVDSSSNLNSPCLPSSFGSNRSLVRTNSKSSKTHNTQSFLKAAIFRSMQKKNNEAMTPDEMAKNRMTEIKFERQRSDESPLRGHVEDENRPPTLHLQHSPEKGLFTTEEEARNDNKFDESPARIERIHLNLQPQTMGSKTLNMSKRKYQPFAPPNLLIPKNHAFN